MLIVVADFQFHAHHASCLHVVIFFITLLRHEIVIFMIRIKFEINIIFDDDITKDL